MKIQDSHSTVEDDRLKITQTEPLWTVKDVSNYLRLKQETVRMMARAKKIPALKVGRVWRFRASDIKKMLKTRTAIKESVVQVMF